MKDNWRKMNGDFDMTNNEAQAYAVVALFDLIQRQEVKVGKARDVNGALRALDSTMYYLMDRYSEEEIVEKMEKIMFSGE